jgi:filamentous hemagglutinin family protein
MKNIRFLGLALILLCLDSSVYANPLGGVVGSGAASITSSGGLLTISQSSDTSIINWNTFNIANGESTVFEFNGAAGANSAVLNLVGAGNGGSTIAGSLLSTVGHLGSIGGTVILLNPDGVLFTPSATVSVGSLVASTLNLPDPNDFLNRTTLHFSGNSTAGIKNQGSLNALGDVFLIAHTVQNSGVISAGNEAGLAAGNTVTLAQSGAERLTVVAGTGTGTPVGVENTVAGKINAATAELKAANGNIYALAINNAGVIRANTFVNEGGHIYLRADGGSVLNGGTLDASGAAPGAQGGEVQVTGGQVTLASGGTVDANGSAGGGTVVVDGDQQTMVEAGATINANATDDGNGGSVSVLSGGLTDFGGSIFARGAGNGAGGNAEISGGQLSLSGHAFLGGDNGANGTLLLDPGSVDVVHEAGATTSPGSGDVYDNWLSGQLNNGGADVTISTSDAYANTVNPANLTVDSLADVEWSSANSLTLSGALSLTLHSGSIINSTGAGNLTLQSASGPVALDGTASLSSGNLSVTAGGAITQSGVLMVNGASATATFAAGAANDITLDNANNDFTTVAITSGKNVTLNDVNNLDLEGFAISGKLDVTAGGQIGLLGDITTVGGQIFNGAAVLKQNVALSDTGSGNITFNSTVDGDNAANNRTLTVNSGGVTTFDGAVGDNQALNSLTTDAAGTTALNGGTVNATAVDFKDDVILGANTTINELSPNGTTTTFEKTVNADSTANNRTLSVQFLTVGGTKFGGAVGNSQPLASLTAYSPGGTLAINGGSVTTSGAQSYFGSMTLGANTTLNGTTLDLFGVLAGGGNNLTLNNSGLSTVGASLNGVNALTGGGGGSLSVLNIISTGTVNDSEATSFSSGGTVATTGTQTYNGAATLGVGTTFSSSGAGANGDISFLQTVNGAQALTVDTAGTTTFGGAVGNNQGLTSLTTDAAGTTALNGGIVNATTTDFKDDVILGANTTLTELPFGTTITFEKTVNADSAANNRTLMIAAGTMTFGGAVGNNQALASLTTGIAGTTAINGGTVATSGAQSYDGNVTLGANTILTSSGGGDITFANMLDGAQMLTVNTSGNEIFNGAIGGNTPLTSVTTDGSGTVGGSALLNGGSVTTIGSQTYNDNVTLGADTTLTSSGGADITFARTIDGAQSLAVNTAGTTTFGGAVGVNQALTSLTTDAAGTTALNGGTVNATTADFKDDVILGANMAFNNTTPFGRTVTFEKTVNADLAANNRTLTIGSPNLVGVSPFVGGTVIFGGAVGNNQALANLTASAPDGTLAINGGSVTTLGSQTYNGDNVNVTLGANTTLNGTTLDLLGAVAGGGNNLTLNNGATATLGGAASLLGVATVSGVNILTAAGGGNLVVNNSISAATFNDSEATTLNGGLVTTTGAQNYNNAVTLGAATTLTSSGGADITFGRTVDGAQTLAVNSSGNEIFNGVMGGSTPLTSVTTDGSGTVGGSAHLNGGSVTTTGGQTYNDNLTLGANTTLNGTTLNLFGAVTGGGNNLTLDNSGAATLNGAVNGVGQLIADGSGTLTVNNTISAGSINDGEATALNGGTVTTIGSQTYGNAVTLGVNTTLNLHGLFFAGGGAIFGNGYLLMVNGIVYSIIGEDETLKRSILGDILPTYQPIEVKARKPWQHKRRGLPPWAITDPLNSLQVPFD